MKFAGGVLAAVLALAILGWMYMGQLMMVEHESPFGVEETAARIQQNVMEAGWDLSGLRNPQRAVKRDGGASLPVLMVEACKTEYSKPILQDDNTRILSILMPCKITVYEKSDGKTYIGTLNAGLMGWMFGVKVGQIMTKVAADQKKFITFDPSKPAPKLIETQPGGGGGGGGAGGGGC